MEVVWDGTARRPGGKYLNAEAGGARVARRVEPVVTVAPRVAPPVTGLPTGSLTSRILTVIDRWMTLQEIARVVGCSGPQVSHCLSPHLRSRRVLRAGGRYIRRGAFQGLHHPQAPDVPDTRTERERLRDAWRLRKATAVELPLGEGGEGVGLPPAPGRSRRGRPPAEQTS